MRGGVESFRHHPRPADVREGVVTTADQLRRWVLSMPEHLQEQFFEDVLAVRAEASKCFEANHERAIEHQTADLARLHERIRDLQSRSGVGVGPAT